MKLPKFDITPWKASNKPVWREPERLGWFPPLVDLIGPPYIRFGLGLQKVELREAARLAEALKGVESHGDRLVLVFRHCGDADPHGVYYALNTLAKPAYRRAGLKRPRFLFLASAEIALWGGGLTDFALRAGGTLSLAHGPGARRSLEYLQKHLEASPDPVVLAPEGQITYELGSPIHLDPGAANIAGWAATAAQGEAKVVPIGLRYLCPGETWARWHRFVGVLERDAGLPAWTQQTSVEADAGARQRRLWDHLLTLGETYYRRKHLRKLEPQPTLDARCRQLTRIAVEVGARARDIAVGDDLRPAIFELRYSAMDLVFPRPRGLSRLEKLMDDRAAAEGWWNNRHQDLADVLQYLYPDSLPAQPSLERSVESVLNLADLAGRLAGGNIKHRPRYFRRVLQLTVGEVWAIDKSDGRPRKEKASEVTRKIQESLQFLSR
ncbi:MAG: hypothetical protein WCG80_08545 [Spirochaetales bacterium]